MSAGLVLLLCALACPLVMGLMMLLMRRSHPSPKRRKRGSENAENLK